MLNLQTFLQKPVEMESIENYKINFAKLKQGVHEYAYSPGDDFFANYENSLVTKCQSKVFVTLDKQKETLFTLFFSINATVKLQCDRCLDGYDYPFKEEYRLIVKLKDEETDEKDEELIILNKNEDEINIAQYLYEFINLSVPMKKTCEDVNKDCNPEIINILNEHQADQEQIDPRWEKLKKFYKNNN